MDRAIGESNISSSKHVRNLLELGLLTWMTGGDQDRSLSLMKDSLGILRNLNKPRELAIVLCEIVEPLLQSCERDACMKYSEEALEFARELGKPGMINYCLIYFCTVLIHTRQYEKEKPLVEELLDSSEKLENIWGIESALQYLGDCGIGTKEYIEGEKWYAQGVETSFKHGTLWLAAFDTQGIAFTLSGQGRYAKAIRLEAPAREQLKQVGIEPDGMYDFWDE